MERFLLKDAGMVLQFNFRKKIIFKLDTFNQRAHREHHRSETPEDLQQRSPVARPSTRFQGCRNEGGVQVGRGTGNRRPEDDRAQGESGRTGTQYLYNNIYQQFRLICLCFPFRSQDQEINQLQKQLKEAEQILSTAIFQARQKLASIAKANKHPVSSEELIKYAHKYEIYSDYSFVNSLNARISHRQDQRIERHLRSTGLAAGRSASSLSDGH